MIEFRPKRAAYQAAYRARPEGKAKLRAAQIERLEAKIARLRGEIGR